jgi:hypothetical protein
MGLVLALSVGLFILICVIIVSVEISTSSIDPDFYPSRIIHPNKDGEMVISCRANDTEGPNRRPYGFLGVSRIRDVYIFSIKKDKPFTNKEIEREVDILS